MLAPTKCERCGEPLGNEPRAELWNPADRGASSVIVHADQCAAELLAKGWEIA